MERQESAIVAKNLKKSYGKVSVLKDVSFTVKKGTIFALLGPNGAGKTTVINILTTLHAADNGTASVDGFDVASNSARVRERISLTGQFAAVDEVLTARENLVLICELRHIQTPDQTATALLQQFDLMAAADRRAGTFSGGMRRRLDIAMSLVGDPSVIFLDEPTTGLDPASRNMMWDTIKNLAESGTTVFLTTQYLEEADQLADKIAILDGGHIVADGTPEELKKLLPHGQVKLTFRTRRELKTAETVLASYRSSHDDDVVCLTVQTDGSVAQLAHLFARLQAARLEVAEFAQNTPTLDDAFFKIIKENEEKQQ